MIRFILVRLIGLVSVLFFVSIITFFLMHEVPGGPWKYGDHPLSDQQIQALKERYGLDKPLPEQYLTWLNGVIHFDFGESFQNPGESVSDVIQRSWPVTLQLGLMALAVAFAIGLPLGIVAALNQNTWIDYLATLVSIAGFVTPHFVLGIFFILLFSLTLHWLPSGGWENPSQWIMPVLVYALAPAATIARYTRLSVLEVIRSDYIRTARAKGLTERLVIGRHVMKNALIPLLTVLAPLIPDMITGSIFVEAIFRVPGLGRYWVTSTMVRDYTMIIGLAMLWAFLIGFTYLITDVLYTIVDPRIRYQ